MMAIMANRCRCSRSRCLAGAVLAALIISASSAFAGESDGYYCVGPDYLAYQFAFTNGSTDHQLNVISLARGFSIAEPAVVELPAFQVHGMRCNETSVELRDEKIVYGVDVSDQDTPVFIGKKELELTAQRRFRQTNLGLWAFAGFRSDGTLALSIPLPRPGLALEAALLIKIEGDKSQRRHISEIVIVNQRTGRVINRTIFEGTKPVARE